MLGLLLPLGVVLLAVIVLVAMTAGLVRRVRVVTTQLEAARQRLDQLDGVLSQLPTRGH